MFVGEAIHEEKSLSNNEAIESFQEDVHVIQSSLTFVDELIKSMLDMHKAENNELHVQEKSTKLATDVFETVRTVVDSKHNPFEFLVDCPPDLTVKTDALKLKQIVMNLATNSRKFVSKGYIKVGAYVKEAKVIVFIEDTGPGIPKEKRALLFSKYQESLDSLTPQGTGLGLSLCKSLVGLMGGEIYLDSSFYSSIADCPAARIIIDLNRPPIEAAHNEGKCTKMEDSLTESIRDIVLPENLSILVVDDDMILRRMIVKALKRVAPSWVVEQCSNGETALKLVEARQYDLIFVDQCELECGHMASMSFVLFILLILLFFCSLPDMAGATRQL